MNAGRGWPYTARPASSRSAGMERAPVRGRVKAIKVPLSFPTADRSTRLYIAMTIVMAFAILALDIWADVDINVGVLYIIVVFMSIKFCTARGVVVVTLCCAVLTFIGYILSPGETFGTTAIANRLLGLLAVGFTTFLGVRDRTAHIALQEAWRQLARANRISTMGELTASIAHEIKQPITAIITGADTALRWLGAQPPELEEARQTLGIIINDGRRASTVTDRIRALVKKEPMRTDSLDLNDLIAEVLLLCRSELQKSRISVETRLAGDLRAVPGDRIQLQQVLLNLVLNANEAMREPGDGQRELLIISANDGPNGVLIMVRDTGKGLSPDDLAHLFNAFYTTKPEGMGMGLRISLSIVQQHGGRLWAMQNEPRGAAFHLSLPADVPATSKHVQEASNWQPLKLN